VAVALAGAVVVGQPAFAAPRAATTNAVCTWQELNLPLSSDGSDGEVLGGDDAGGFVGYIHLFGTQQAAYWHLTGGTVDTFTLFGEANAKDTRLVDMNSSHIAVGDTVDQHAVVHDPSHGWTLLPDGGGGASMAAGINDSGFIAGAVQDATGWWHAALWTLNPNGAVTLQLLPYAGHRASQARGIDNAGEIVGWTNDLNASGDGWPVAWSVADPAAHILPSRADSGGVASAVAVSNGYAVGQEWNSEGFNVSGGAWVLPTGAQRMPGGPNGSSINPAGQVAINVDGFPWVGDITATDHTRLPTSPGNNRAWVSTISADGIAGGYDSSKPVLWTCS
jgi:uncharacterized membrane protein